MNQPRNSTRKLSLRASLLIAVVMAVISASYFKWLDDYSSDYTDSAIKQAAISYATARGINALVSVLQTSTIEGDAIFISGSVSIGELLDPVNDLIERFSTVMTLVLGSLAIQKILFVLTGHDVFLHIVAVSGLFVISCLLFNWNRAFTWAVRFFAVTLLLRFCFVLVLAVNGLVDEGFLWNETQKYDENVKLFQRSIDPAGDTIERQDAAPEDAEGFVKTARDWVGDLDLADLQNKVERSINDFMMLMAIYLIKTIALPLLFLYLVIYATRLLWRLDYDGLVGPKAIR